MAIFNKKSGFVLVLIAMITASTLTSFAQTPTATPIPDPEGCQKPPEDYTRVEVNGATLSQRTLAMLSHAETLYDGNIDLDGIGITQGSYNAGRVALSFGTHDEGGAVDISVRNLPQDWTILWDDIPSLIEAMRRAGFAAWFRGEDDDMTPHIHAIAIGDAELSRAASLQLDGRYGYFRGFDGLPQADGVPQADDSGQMILCEWMREFGYEDLREQNGVLSELPTPPYDFRVGDIAAVNTTWGGELNLRENPTIRAPIVMRLTAETRLEIVGAAQSADGFRWWQVQTEDGQLGWAADVVDGAFTLVPFLP